MEQLKSIFKKIIVAIITAEAKMVLRKYRPKIVAVTGNVGKTSTKDAIFTVLSAEFHVRKSDKSFNSEIGVPLTILGRPNAWSSPSAWFTNIIEGFLLVAFKYPYPEWLVLEVGADRPLDIANTSKWIKPDIAVITRLPDVPVHVEFFPSAEAVRVEKLSMLKYVKEGGTIIGNGDDPYIRKAFDALPAETKRLYYGLKKESDVHGDATTIVYEGTRATGMRGLLQYKNAQYEFFVHGSIGQSHVLAALGGAAVGIASGIAASTCADALKKHETPPGRMHLVEGKNDTLIIDDTYNSSPSALESALAALKSVRGGRKIAVLGDMMELGEHSHKAHQEAGIDAGKHAQILLTVGVRARGIAESAKAHGMPESCIQVFDSAQNAAQYLSQHLQKQDVILVKGSQSIRLEKVVEALMAHPEQKKKLLVRQDEEWMKR